MKSLLLLNLLLLSLFAQTNREWIDTIVESIAQSRKGIDTTLLSTLKDPFVTQETLEKAPQKNLPTQTTKVTTKRATSGTFTLSTIFNDKAKINNNWYTIGDSVGSYTLKKIENGRVHLMKNDNSSIILSLTTRNEKIKLQAK